jgi:hypothetical protein
VIDLSKATIGLWDADNTANAGNGIYDGAKWAVVFKYTSVNIPADVSVTFIPNASRAPVVWLVSGDVKIDGSVSPGGAGAFRRGRLKTANAQGSAGYGIGGGQFPSQSGTFRESYGNTSLVPLIGGSGGGGNETGDGGGIPNYSSPGGGAILIVATGTISINGTVSASTFDGYGAGTGSGGAIRLVCTSLTGTGRVEAVGGPIYRSGGDGRIRIEALSVTGSITAVPETSFFTPKNPVQLWPEETAPSVRLVSVGGGSVPADPKALLNLPGADVNIEVTGSQLIVIESRNLPTNSVVQARITPWEGPFSWVSANFTSGDSKQALWTATADLSRGFNAIQASGSALGGGCDSVA